jgi:CDP-diacylglycerol--glycerol-3-phosphate 3-phosphatidyltransferase
MTLTRGLLVGLLAGFVFIPLPPGVWAWLPALLYGSERLLDFMDGYVARVTGRESRLGSILDMEFDGLGILIGTAVAVQMGKLPPWYLLLGMARPLFVLGLYLRRRWALPVHHLAPSSQRRLVAGVQTAFVSVMLWPPLPPTLTHLAAIIFALPLSLSFARDWLVVSGRLDVTSAGYTRAHARASTLLEEWLPVAARAAGGAAAAWLLWQAPPAGGWERLIGVAAGLGTILFVLGAAGRAAALLLLAYVMYSVTVAGMNGGVALLLACAALVLHVGSGRLALWQPEERLFRATLGAALRSGAADTPDLPAPQTEMEAHQ